MLTRRNPKKLAEHYNRLREEGSKPNVHSDFSRLGRLVLPVVVLSVRP